MSAEYTGATIYLKDEIDKSFVLEVEVQYEGYKNISFIQGYIKNVDNVGVYYITGIIDYVRYRDLLIEKDVCKLITNANVVTATETRRLSRPEDIMEKVAIIEMYNSFKLEVTKLGLETALSDRANNLASSYMAKVVKCVEEGKALSRPTDDVNQVLMTMQSLVRESAIQTHTFMHDLISITGEFYTNTFDENTLNTLANNNLQVNYHSRNRPTKHIVIYDSSACESSHRLAVETSHFLMKVLPEVGIKSTKIELTCTAGVNDIVISNSENIMDDYEYKDRDNILSSKIKHLLIPTLLSNGISVINIDVTINIFTEAIFSITYSDSKGNVNKIDYLIPVYLESLYTPVVCDSESLNSISEGVIYVLDKVLSYQY